MPCCTLKWLHSSTLINTQPKLVVMAYAWVYRCVCM